MAIIRSEDRNKRVRYRQLVMFLWGLPWSGKTYSATAIAMHLARLLKRDNKKPGDGRVLVIDSEESATDYDHLLTFDLSTLTPPYTPEKFITALYEAQAAGYSAIVLDSLSSEWNESGGILREIDKLKETSRVNPWSVMTPRHEKLLETMNRLGIPIICTAKSAIKTGINEQVDDRGNKRAVPVKIGERPIFRPEDEYQFKIIAQMAETDDGRVLKFNGKCRVHDLYRKEFLNPGLEVAQVLAAWIKGQADDTDKEADEKEAAATVSTAGETSPTNAPESGQAPSEGESAPVQTETAPAATSTVPETSTTGTVSSGDKPRSTAPARRPGLRIGS